MLLLFPQSFSFFVQFIDKHVFVSGQIFLFNKQYRTNSLVKYFYRFPPHPLLGLLLGKFDSGYGIINSHNVISVLTE